MITTLADLLAPVSLPEFLEVFRARKRLHISASDSTRAQTLFSWHDIETLLSGHGLDENVSIQRDGALVPRKLYVSSEGKHLNVRALHDLLTQGVSIIVNAVDHSIPQIRQLAAAIEREMGIRTFVNAYLSFAKGGAFKPHWDTHDVLAVQVHGNKRWRIWNAVVPHPVEMANEMQINASAPPDQEIELAAGDVLFIPRGEPHAANVSAARSVHLTIGLESQTGIDFLNYICREAAKDPILRMDLPRRSFAEQRDAHEDALKRQVHQLIDAVSMSQFLQKGDLSRSATSQTAVAGALPKIDDVLRLTLRRRVPLPDVAPEGGPQPVTIAGETRHLSPAAIDVLRWLFDHDPATLRALHVGLTPRHEPDAIEAAIRELLRFGFIVVNRGG
jgi:ribosomal protein L16 Arg81 hydroxylase